MEKREEQVYLEEEEDNNREEQLRRILPDISTAWDPMGYTFNSPLNRFELDMKDVTQGEICIFYDGFSNTCCMGDNCRALHVQVKEAGDKRSGPLTSEKKFQNQRVQKDKRQERVSCANDLHRRGVAAPASLFKGVVSCAEAPSNFFVVPQFDLNCACSGILSQDVQRQKENSQHDPSEQSGICSAKKYIGIEGYNAFVENASKDMAKRSEAYNSCHGYEESELVAFDAGSFSMKKPHRLLWLRGVLPAPVYEEDYKTFLTSEVFLFDNGHTVTTNTCHIRQLPLLYSKVPPLAIRCGLYGIRPKRSPKKNPGKSEPQWSVDAIRDFQKLIKSPKDLMDTQELQTKNLLIVEVKKSTCTDSDGVFQPTPYSVMITVEASTDQNRKAVNVSEEMVKLGHAEFTNFNPECGFSFSEWEFWNPLSSLR